MTPPKIFISATSGDPRAMKTLRLFISSPGDVGRERHATAEIIRRLQSEFAEHVTLDPYFWEWEPVDFSKDYQANIPSTADFDIVICILWSRLGSRLSDQHKLPPDYTRPASSGTEYELLQALHGQKQHPDRLPDLLVWRNESPPLPASAPPLSREEEDERIRQRRALQDFLTSVTRDPATGSFIAALNSYQYLDQFEELMEGKLRKLIQKHIGERTVKPKPQWQGSPFRDLDVFEFEHAPIFFGRSRAFGEVVRLLQSTLSKPQPCHFALILGASGSGKSSLARAGVLPLLTRPGVIEGIGFWRCAIVRPSDDSADLFQALAAALLDAAQQPEGRIMEGRIIGTSFPDPNHSTPHHFTSIPRPPALPELADPESPNPQDTLAAELRAHPQTVAIRVKDQLNAVAKAHQTQQRHTLEAQITNLTKEGRQADAALKQQALQQLQEPKARLVLLLDQMEELFTLNYAPEQLRAFLETIDVLARSGRVFVIGTLRSDFYPRYQEQPTLVALARDGARFDLLPPTPDEISQIIRRPASLAALQFEPHPTTAEHTLADTLRDEALADTVALPLLEHVLNRLYQAQLPRADGRLTFADYEDICGVDVDPKTHVKTSRGVGGALGKHAEDIFTGQNRQPTDPPPPWTEDTFRAVFRCLVTFGKGEGDTDVPNRRAFTYQDLIQSDPAAQALVDTFIHERLLIADTDAQSRPIVRLSHEALLTRWPRLANWLQTAPVRDLMSQRRRLESSLRQWQEQNRTPDCYLQPGFELEEGKQLLEKHEAALKPEEREFIRESVAYHAERERKAVRRRRLALTVLSGLTILALLLGGIAAQMKRAAETQRAEAEKNLDRARIAEANAHDAAADSAAAADKAYLAQLRANSEERKAKESLVKLQAADAKQEAMLLQACHADHEAALRAFSEQQPSEGLAYLERALSYAPRNSAALAASAAHAFGSNAPNWRTRSVSVFESTVSRCAFSPDGRYLAVVVWVEKTECQVWVIEAATGKEVSKAEFGDFVKSVCFSPDGRYLAACGQDKTARMIEAATGKEVSRAVFLDRVNSVSFSPDGRYLTAVGGAWRERGEARVIEAATGKEVSRAIFPEEVTSVSFSPDGRYLSLLSNGLQKIEAATGKVVSRLEFSDKQSWVSSSPDGRFIAVEGEDYTVQVLEAATGKKVSQSVFGRGVGTVIFSPDGRYIAAGVADHTARVIEAATGKEISQAVFGSSVESLSFSPDGRYIAVASRDETGRIIEAVTGKEISRISFGARVISVNFSPDGRYLAVGNTGGTLRVMEAVTGKEINRTVFGGWGHYIRSLSFSPDSRQLGGGGGRSGNTQDSEIGEVRVIETATSKEVSRAEVGKTVTSVSFSPNGRHLAAGSDNKTAWVIDITTGKDISRAEFSSEVTSVSFSPDGRHFAAGIGEVGSRGEVQVIEAATGTKISPSIPFGAKVSSVCYSSDGRYLAAGCHDGSARLIAAETNKQVKRAEFDGWPVTSVSFSPDGVYLAAGTARGTSWVIEMASGKEVSRAVFEVGKWVRSVSFSLDSRYLATSCSNGMVQVMEAATGKEISRVAFGYEAFSVGFSPDGRYLAGSCTNTAMLFDWTWTKADAETPKVWRAALALQSGLQFQPTGELKAIPGQDLSAAYAEIQTYLAEEPAPREGWTHAILEWSQMLPEERTTSPWTTEPIRVATGRWFMQTSGKLSEMITSIADEAPWHPLEPVSLARLELKTEDESYDAAQGTVRPTFLARLTLKRLRQADENLYGRDTLAEYAAWSAKIMHEELHLDPEALEALTFALERTPPDKQRDLLELKAKLEAK